MPPETPAPIPPPEAPAESEVIDVTSVSPVVAPAAASDPQTGLHSPHVLGTMSLGLLGLTAFFVVFAYMDGLVPKEGQVAAAAAEVSDAFAGISLEAQAAIVIDVRSGEVLYEKNSNAQLPLASLTKVPLALAVSEVLSLENVLTIPYDTAFTEGGQRLLKGEEWKVQDILHFTLIASSNEGAEILAAAADARIRALYPDAPPSTAALWRMNDLVKGLGLSSMYFFNVSGLDASATQAGAYGSAHDVAQLFIYAAQARPDVFAGTTKDDLLLVDENGETTAAFNTNEILGSIPGLMMGKTGYTDLAGANLAIVFDAGLSQPVAAVVMHSSPTGRFTDMRLLVERTLEAISQK